MRNLIRTAVISAVGIVFVVMSIAGCQEQNPSATRMSKLIALENRQLKKQLETCGEEIERQKGLLNECQDEKQVLTEQLEVNFENILVPLLKEFADKDKKLREENAQLKAQIEELEVRIEELQKEFEESLQQPEPAEEPETL